MGTNNVQSHNPNSRISVRVKMKVLKLEHAKLIHIVSQSATILMVVWFANGNGSALTSKTSSKVNLLHDRCLSISLCDRNCVVLRTNRATYTFYRKILDLLGKAFWSMQWYS